MRLFLVAAAVAACSCSSSSVEAVGIPVYGYQIVNTYPHDTGAFTEGLFYFNGFLYESTGQNGQSSIRKVKLETGEVLQKREISENYFGEGIINWKDKLYELTWQTEVGFIYNFETFAPQGQFHYPGEGWSMTTDGKRIIMDDGTPEIRFWDPETLEEKLPRLTVTADGQPVQRLNELEWVNGEIYANIWETDRIARIDPKSGKVVGWIDCSGLLAPGERTAGSDSVLNGIAYDAAHNRLFVTGKNWPKLFEIRLVKKSATQ
jgi:glutaminyl-peptide cyclotransferase